MIEMHLQYVQRAGKDYAWNVLKNSAEKWYVNQTAAEKKFVFQKIF